MPVEAGPAVGRDHVGQNAAAFGSLGEGAGRPHTRATANSNLEPEKILV